MTEELYNAAQEYAEAIGDNFPVYLFREYTEERILTLIAECIEKHKTAEEISGRKYEEGADY